MDCGGDNGDITANEVTNYLFSQGVFHLDGLILTHYDADHAGAVLSLLEFVEADRIWMPEHWDSNGIRQQIQQACPDRTVTVAQACTYPFPQGSFQLFPAQNPADDNESSMCVLFQAENCDILITGDRTAAGERKLLEQTELPKLEVLVAGHHGSKNATSYELLAATQPLYAVISVGEDNDYGHPHSQTLERLESFGCTVLRTDLQGNIIFRR